MSLPVTAPDVAAGRRAAFKKKFAEQPRGVYLLFCTELWERFSYYGMLGLLVLFLVAPASTGGFGWDNALALRVFGTFLGLIWFAPLIGGWIADRFTGARCAVVSGCVSLALGNFLLAGCALTSDASATLFGSPLREALLYAGLASMVIGAGLFKSNVSVLMGELFTRRDDPRRDFGFTLFYMGINAGALLAPLIAGTLGERVGWHWGFGVSGVGMLIGIVIFLATNSVLGEEGPRPNRKQQAMIQKATLAERQRVLAIGVFAIFATVFATGLMQYGGLLNLFTAQNIERSMHGFEIPATWFLMLNPLFIVLLGPLVAARWDYRSQTGLSSSSTEKFATGLILMAFAFGLIGIAALDAAPGMPASWWWIVLFYLVFTTGELCIYPVGLALVSRLAPHRWMGVLMGAWLLTNALGSWLAGELGAIAQRVGASSVFASLALVALIAAVVLWSLRRRLVRLAGAVPF